MRRVEGPAKVAGRARYETDVHFAGMARAAIANAIFAATGRRIRCLPIRPGDLL